MTIKTIETDKYKIYFNLINGAEITLGINGNPDPHALKYPSMIDVGIMGHCKNNCNFCYQGDKSEPNMTLNNFKTIIDESTLLTNQVALGGRGDPNHHEDFEGIMRYARDNSVIPNFTTSGIDLTFEQVEITKAYAGAVAVSDYNNIHTYKALKLFMDAGCKTNIHYVVTQNNMGTVLDLLNGKDRWGGKVDLERLNAVIFLLFKQQGSGIDASHLIPTTKQTELFSQAILSPECKFKVGMDSCMINKVMQHRPLTEAESLCADTCEAGRMSMYITPNMTMLPCSFGDHKLHGVPFNGKNIGTIQSIWKQQDLFQQFRNILKDEPGCCPYEELWKQFKPLMDMAA